MTIRYTCVECGSSLKIRDEKAGTEGKCPKCGTGFQVPDADEATETTSVPLSSDGVDSNADLDSLALPDGEESEKTPVSGKTEEASGGAPSSGKPASSEPRAESAGPGPEPIDMPLEVTPVVAEEPSPEDSTTANPAVTVAVGGPAENKPSVAELMKEHQAAKAESQRKRENRAAKKNTTEDSRVRTTGSAAQALERTYQQKRDKANRPPEDDEPDVERQQMMAYFGKIGGGVLAILVLCYGLYAFMTREDYSGLPDLYEVTGRLVQNGSGVAGYTVQFNPQVPPGAALAVSSSQGKTDAEGNFTLMYRADIEGVVSGNHAVVILDPTGLPAPLSADQAMKTVPEEDGTTFEFQL